MENSVKMKDEPAGICISCITKCAIASSEFDAMDYKYPEITSCKDHEIRKTVNKNEDYLGLNEIADSDWQYLYDSFWKKTQGE